MNIELYSKDACGQCMTAKSLLKSKCIPFNEIILGKDVSVQDLQKRVQELNSDKPLRSAPQIIIDNQHVGELKDLIEFLKDKEPLCNKV